MAALSHAESRRLYSWWWDSHISPKLSKWLEDNLSDMDNKIKAMIRLIEEDADSFAQRAELYFKKRPELIKLVEEFYRAYRALAERYDYATGALRQAHKTIAKAFPNQIPLELCDESLFCSPAMYSERTNNEITQGMFDPHSEDLLQDLFGLSGITELSEAYSDETKVKLNETCLRQTKEMFIAREEDASGATSDDTSEEKISECELFKKEISRLLTENQDLKKQISLHTVCADKTGNCIQHLKADCFKVKSENYDAPSQKEEFMERVSYLQDEISRAKAELKKLINEMTMESSYLRNAEVENIVLENDNQSFQLELDILKQKIREHHEKLNQRGQEIENEHQKTLKAERAFRSIEKQHSEIQIEMSHLKLENEKLRDMEEELQNIREQNIKLSEQNLLSALKIEDLQDEISFLLDLKRKFEDETDLHIEEKEALQLELHHLTIDRNDLQSKHNVLIEEIQAVNSGVESLQALIMDLRDRNLQLEDIIKKSEAESNHFQTTSAKNAVVLAGSLLDAHDEVARLRIKVKELEESSNHLRSMIPIHLAEKAALISRIQASTHNMEKLLGRNTLLENSLSDINPELEGLREKLKGVEEFCKHLRDENSSLLSEKNALILQVESTRNNLENLEGRYHELEDKSLNLEKENDCMLHCVAKLQDLLRPGNEELATHIQSGSSQLSTLANQILILQEKCTKRDEDFDIEQGKLMDAQIEIFILQRCLCEMKEENSILSVKYQKQKQALKRTEERILALERECLAQEEKMESMIEHNVKLREWIHLVIGSLKIDLQDIAFDDIRDELLLQIALREIRQMLHSISVAQDEKQHLLLEKSVVLALVEQLGKFVADVRVEKAAFDSELKMSLQQITLLKSTNDELLQINEQLRMEMQASNQREEELKTEMDLLFGQLRYLQEAHCTLQNEISKMLRANSLMSKQLLDLSQAKVRLEEENNVMLTDVMALDYLSVMFESINSERVLELQKLCNERDNLHKLKNMLEKKTIILLEDCTCKNNEIEYLHQANQALKRKLKEAVAKVQSSDAIITSMAHNILFESINASVCKERVLELIEQCENLESSAIVQREVVQEEITLKNVTIEQLEQKIQVLEGENGELMADLSAYELFWRSLVDDVIILEELTFSLAKRHSTSISLREEDDQVEHYPWPSRNLEESGLENNETPPKSLLKLHYLHEKVKMLQEVMINTGSMIELERFDSNASLEAAWKEIEELKSKKNPGKKMTKQKHKRIMKDIQLDIVLDPSRYGNVALSHGLRKDRKTFDTTDQMLELWGIAEGYGHQKQKGPLVVEKNIAHFQTEEEDKYTSKELVIADERDLGMYKRELTQGVSSQDWNRRIMERLSSDARRLSVLKASLQELLKCFGTSDNVNHQSTKSEFSGLKFQLKEAEGSISQLIDVNCKLKSKVEDVSASLERVKDEDIVNKRRKQISDWAIKVSEKIARLELEMPKFQHSLLKFDEEHLNKRSRVKRRSGVRLREYIYGRRNSRRQKELSSCGCMRSTTSD